MKNTLAPRPENVQRAELRQKCRKILADYLRKNSRAGMRAPLINELGSELGLNIKPEDVRLKPCGEDGYRWVVLRRSERLFETALSKHSIGAYKELCREVGISFKAVAPESSTDEPYQVIDEVGLLFVQSTIAYWPF